MTTANLPLILLLVVFLVGCSSPPPATTALAQLPDHFQRHQAIAEPALVPDAKASSLWMQPMIQAWIHDGMTHNPSLQAALANLQSAHELTLAQKSSLLPNLSAGYSGQRSTLSSALSSPLQSPASPYTLHTAQVTVSYAPDVFGLNHALLYSIQAQETLAAAQYDAARLALAGTIAATAIQLAWAEDSLHDAQNILSQSQQLTRTIQQGLALGFNTRSDLLQQQQQEKQFAAQIPVWEKQKEASLDLLAVLTGQTPDHMHAQPLHLADLVHTASPVLSLPSSLVRRRPDIRAAQAQVQSAAAGLGIAVASRWPQFSLTAAWGGSSTLLGTTLSPADRFWSLGASISQPIFDFGVLKHRQKAAQDNLQASEAQYRMTVLQALQNVADSLYALQTDEKSLRQTQIQEQCAEDLLRSSQHRLHAGMSSALDLLQNRISTEQSRMSLLQAQASRLQDLVALHLALGLDFTDENGVVQVQHHNQRLDKD